MKRFRWMAMFLVGVMLLAISGSAFAAVKDDTVSPLYLYTRKVTASLSISDGGKATCYGYVRANSSGGSISITITLYRQSGKSWSKVTSWSTSGTSQILDIEKTKSYYNQIRSEDLCDCDYCKNNIHEVKAAYPTSFIDTS